VPNASGPGLGEAVADHGARRERLRQHAAAAGLEAALITSLTNVRYLTGLASSNAAVLLRINGDDLLATDFRYATQARRQAPDLHLLRERRLLPALAKVIDDEGIGVLGYETHVITVDEGAALSQAAPQTRLVSLDGAVEEMRAVKDAAELALIRRACALADEALNALLGAGGVRAGRSEIEIARDIGDRMLDLGAEAVGFDTIVAAGPDSAIPHHRPGPRLVERGDLVTIDFGAQVGGYHSDTTRTFGVGRLSDWQRDIYRLVAEAESAGIAAARPGADTVAVDRAAREVIAAAGHGDDFGHGLGHGVGLEIHEAPAISPLSAGKLASWMSVTVEPGVYLEGRGGVRIEDTVVVDAEPETLTTATRDLLIL
jgi:Xaa-Pro aminopeptidase